MTVGSRIRLPGDAGKPMTWAGIQDDTSPSGMCSRKPTRPPAVARSRRSPRQNAPALAYPGAASSASRTEMTARRCASRANAGGTAR